MIARNEEKNLEKCLELLRPHFAEIILADTGSSDLTVSIAKEAGVKVVHFDWCSDFSAARNFSISHARYDWVLAIDCDEYLTEIDTEVIALAMESYPQGIGMIIRDNPSEKDDGVMTERVARLFDRRVHHYQGSIHEQAVSRLGAEIKYFSIPIRFYHKGYIDSAVAKAKANLYLEMLLMQLELNEDDPYIYFQIGQSYRALGDSEMACHYYGQGLEFDLDPRLDYVQTMVESYGYALLDSGRVAEAMSFVNIYDEFAKRADFIFLMGLIYMNNAHFDLAIAEFEKATMVKDFSVTGVNSFRAFYNIGVIHECRGEPGMAKKYYQKCGDYLLAKERLELLSG
jgi:glycosyltransferase involved in cell wall biosynthesis